MSKYDYPIVVIGAGAGGLVVAIGAARAGKKVLLIERGTWGGDCTNFGCVPSKSLIASAHAAHAITHASHLGVDVPQPQIDATGSLDRVRRIVAQIREHEEPDALVKAGVHTLTGTAEFEDPHTLLVHQGEGKSHRIKASQIVIATGSHPVNPRLEGLADVHALNNETIFDLEEIPKRLLVMGGGPIGSELAQAFHRLGAEVVIIQRHGALLMKEEPEAQEAIGKAFRDEGIELALNVDPIRARQDGSDVVLDVKCKTSGELEELRGSHLLVAAGRRATLEPLNLEAAKIERSERGITVDRYGRTSQKNIWAIGDALGGALFTHLAENHGRTVLTSLLTPGPFNKALDLAQPVPRVTYTDPEVACSGMLEKEAVEALGAAKVATYLHPMSEVDRAITAGETQGLIKVITKKWSSRILGVTIVAPRAGEMLGEITLAMREKIPLRKLRGLIHPYPTYSLGLRQTADKWLTQTILGAVRGKGKR